MKVEIISKKTQSLKLHELVHARTYRKVDDDEIVLCVRANHFADEDRDLVVAVSLSNPGNYYFACSANFEFVEVECTLVAKEI